MKPDIKWLDNPEVFRVNVLPACSDHQFYQSREEMKEDKNALSLSLNGTWQFLYSKNAKEIVRMVPLDRILIETDSPYLAPEPVRGTRNDSSNLKFIVQKIAEFINTDQEKIARITYENAENLFLY